MAKASDYARVITQDLNYKLAYNQVEDRVEVNGEPISDVLEADIRVKAYDRRCQNRSLLQDVIVSEALKNCYHPIKQYLADLPGWDGKDYIADLASYFQNPDGLFHLYLRHWLIGAVAKVYTDAQNPMLVLDGPQKIGKSYLVRWLCGSVLRYFIASPIDPDIKEHMQHLAGKWIWEAAELGSTIRRADFEALKHFLTLTTVNVRKAYGHHVWEAPALASFIGTINNNGGFLNDPTGSRRFMVCKIDSIDWAYTSIPVSCIWSQALAAYMAGEDWMLSPQEFALSEANNENYQVESPVELIIRDKFEIDPAMMADVDYWIPTVEITRIVAEEKSIKMADRALQMEIASVLKKMGLERERVTFSKLNGLGSVIKYVSTPTWKGIRVKP